MKREIKNKRLFITACLLLIINLILLVIIIFKNYKIDEKYYTFLITFFIILVFLFFLTPVFIRKEKKFKKAKFNFEKFNSEPKNEFTLLYNNLKVVFTEEGLQIVDKNITIPYGDIEFTCIKNIHYQNKLFTMNIKFNPENIDFDSYDNLDFTNELMFWIDKYYIYVHNLEVLNVEDKNEIKEKTKFFAYGYSFPLLIIILFLLFVFTALLAIITSPSIMIISIFIIVTIYFTAQSFKKTLYVTNLGFTIETNTMTSTNKRLRDKIFYPYEDLKKIKVLDEKIVVEGKYSSFEFNNNDRVMKYIFKYVDKDRIENEIKKEKV